MHRWIGEVDGHAGAWGWVHGGMGAVSRCLVVAARAAGAETRAGAPVARGGGAGRPGCGGGARGRDRIGAGTVVSGAHPQTTYLDLVGEEHLPGEVVRKIRRYRTRSGSVKVNLAGCSSDRFGRGWRLSEGP